MDDTAFQPQPVKKQPATRTNDSIIESLRTLGSGVGKTVVRDVAGRVASDALSSIFGGLPKQGELKPNQPIDIRTERQPMPAFRRPEVNRPPVVRLEEVNLKHQIEAVRQELKALAASLKTLNLEVQKAVAEVPVAPGVYHLNFFEHLKSILKVLREQIDDSRTWLAMHTARKQKKNYWGMFKKHGTSFGLSSERTLATQAG